MVPDPGPATPGAFIDALTAAHDAVEQALLGIAGLDPGGSHDNQAPARAVLTHINTAMAAVRTAHAVPVVADAWGASRRALDHLDASRRLLRDGLDDPIDGALTDVLAAVERRLRTVSTRARDRLGEVTFQDGWLSEAARRATEPALARDPRLGTLEPSSWLWHPVDRESPGPPAAPDIIAMDRFERELEERAAAYAGGDHESLRAGLEMIMLGKPFELWLRDLPEWAVPVTIARRRGAALVVPRFVGYLHMTNVEVVANALSMRLAQERARASGSAYGIFWAGWRRDAIGRLEVRQAFTRTALDTHSRPGRPGEAEQALGRYQRVIWYDSKLSNVVTPAGEVHGPTPHPAPYQGSVSPRRTVVARAPRQRPARDLGMGRPPGTSPRWRAAS